MLRKWQMNWNYKCVLEALCHQVSYLTLNFHLINLDHLSRWP